MHKKARKAARPCKITAAQSITIPIPDNVKPLLAACSAFIGVTPEDYARQALYALLICDADYVWFEAVKHLNEGGEV